MRILLLLLLTTGLVATGWAQAPAEPSPHPEKLKPTERPNALPGELGFKDLFTMILSETAMSPEEAQPLREAFEQNAAEVAAKTKEYASQTAKTPEAEQAFRAYMLQKNMQLIGAIPATQKARFGAAWLGLYVVDRLSPIGASLTPAQRAGIRTICTPRGASYAGVVNPEERAALEADAYQDVYASVLDAEQKKLVPAK